MSRKENLQERFLDKPSEKLADLEKEIARQDAEAAKAQQERSARQQSSESKYAPKNNFFKVDFQPASSGQTIARKTVASTGAMATSPSEPASSSSSSPHREAPVRQPAAEVNKEPVRVASSPVSEDVRVALSSPSPVEKKSVQAPIPVVAEEPPSPPVPPSGSDEDALEDSGNKQPEVSGASSNFSSVLFWNICIILGIGLVGGMGYMIYEQSKIMPEDPLTKANNEFEQVRNEYNKKKLEFFDVEKRKIRNKALIEKGEAVTILEQNVDLKNKKISDLEREILGVRGEMRSYFQRYKADTRRKARNLHFDTIMTEKTKKTYLDVSIQRVTDSYISIVHAGGATRLDPSDLPEALQNRLGFGDPLGLKLMEAEVAQEKQEKEALDKYLPASHSLQERQMLTEQLTEIVTPVQQQVDQPAARQTASSAYQPAARPAPVPASDIEPASGKPRVDTSGHSLDDNWVPPAAPQPFPVE